MTVLVFTIAKCLFSFVCFYASSFGRLFDQTGTAKGLSFMSPEQKF